MEPHEAPATPEAILILPWVLAGRNLALSLLLLALGNVTACLAWDQLLGKGLWESPPFHLWMCAGNSVVWLAWELFRRRAPGPLAPSGASRVLAVLCLFFATVPTWISLVDSPPPEGAAAGPVFLAALLVAIFLLLRPRDRDLFQPAAGLAAAISAVTVAGWRVLDHGGVEEEFGFLFLGLLVLAQVAAAAAWLRRAGRPS